MSGLRVHGSRSLLLSDEIRGKQDPEGSCRLGFVLPSPSTRNRFEDSLIHVPAFLSAGA